MPASITNTSRRTAEQVNSDQTFARTEQAAHLLREALALLNVGSKPSTALMAMKRAPDRLLRLPEVERLTGLRRSAIYEQMQRGIFPRSVKVGPRAATWSETDVQGWISDRLGRGLR
jgi:prophage regulatory protein